MIRYSALVIAVTLAFIVVARTVVMDDRLLLGIYLGVLVVFVLIVVLYTYDLLHRP